MNYKITITRDWKNQKESVVKAIMDALEFQYHWELRTEGQHWDD